MHIFVQELFPANKRDPETFCAYFREKGLGAIADMQMSSQATKAKKEAQKALSEMINDESPVADVSRRFLLKVPTPRA